MPFKAMYIRPYFDKLDGVFDGDVASVVRFLYCT